MLGELLITAVLVLVAIFGQDEVLECVNPVPDALGEGHEAETDAEYNGAGYTRI